MLTNKEAVARNCTRDPLVKQLLAGVEKIDTTRYHPSFEADSIVTAEEVGFILGTAVYYLNKNTNIEEVAFQSYAAHDYLIRTTGCAYCDDDDTCFGFITSKGIFLRREEAYHVYQEMLRAMGYTESHRVMNSIFGSLFSYDLKLQVRDEYIQRFHPELIEK